MTGPVEEEITRVHHEEWARVVARLARRLGDLDLAEESVAEAFLVAFAGLEHVNYFHVQLMHDTRADWAYLLRHRRLRRAPLADDLRRTR